MLCKTNEKQHQQQQQQHCFHANPKHEAQKTSHSDDHRDEKE